MCLAIPGKITSIKNSIAHIEYEGAPPVDARIVIGSYTVGDYVIAQANMVIEKIPASQMELWKDFLKAESR